MGCLMGSNDSVGGRWDHLDHNKKLVIGIKTNPSLQTSNLQMLDLNVLCALLGSILGD